jgi:hypothetical protein
MDRFDDTLAAELRALRPTPRPEFTAELDQRAAAGFPRGADTTASVFAPLADWWRGLKPTRRLVPILGVAVLAVVVATAAVAISQSGSSPVNVEREENGLLSQVETFGSSDEEGEAAESSGGGGAEAAGEAEAAESSAAAAGAEEESGSVEAESTIEAAPAVPNAEKAPKAPAQAGRDIEGSSSIVLGTKPGEVSGAAAKVYEAVHAADGFVLNSSVQSGSTGATGATFELSIPTAKLDDALGAISAIAEVRERHDATNDITAPTVSTSEELADSNAAIEGLLKQLGEVETEAEQESVEARLREERRHHAAIRASLDHLHQRASMSEVSVRIVTNDGAGVTPPSKDKGDWGVGDALHDAGNILTIAAGVVLIGLAVLAPFALLALIFWAGNSFRVRRLRERTLG